MKEKLNNKSQDNKAIYNESKYVTETMKVKCK